MGVPLTEQEPQGPWTWLPDDAAESRHGWCRFGRTDAMEASGDASAIVAEQIVEKLNAAEAAQAWLIDHFFDEDTDDREPSEIPLLDLAKRLYDWANLAWANAGAEVERADQANSRLHAAVTRADEAEARLVAAQEALRQPVTVYEIAFDDDSFGLFTTREAAEADLQRQIANGGPGWYDCEVVERTVHGAVLAGTAERQEEPS